LQKCGVSVGIVKRIASEATKLCSAEYEAGPSFTFLWKTCKRVNMTDIDDIDLDVVWRTVHEFCWYHF